MVSMEMERPSFDANYGSVINGASLGISKDWMQRPLLASSAIRETRCSASFPHNSGTPPAGKSGALQELSLASPRLAGVRLHTEAKT
jgi:hypothetical protein